MSKSIHNKDWDNFVESLDDKTKDALNEYDNKVFELQQKPSIIISSSEVVNVINEILNKNE